MVNVQVFIYLCTDCKRKVMPKVELVMPKMGESIIEATILEWKKQVGEMVQADDTILEIATDKVDTEVPAPVAGKLIEILYPVNTTVEVGKVLAIIETNASADSWNGEEDATEQIQAPSPEPVPVQKQVSVSTVAPAVSSTDGRFYSPLVRKIAAEESISFEELAALPGTGQQGRVTKHDILSYIKNRQAAPLKQPVPAIAGTASVSGEVEIIEMDRMRRLIADHMIHSKNVAAHVTSFVEVDVTDMVQWRERVKDDFQQSHGEKLTFTPLFVEAVVNAMRDFPLINSSVDGYTIIRKKDFNIGMATALPNGNLIVPVIKNAERLNLLGMAQKVNDLADRARKNKLQPHETQDGTFTITNIGGFGNIMGTPIINQPQVAILAIGTIKKKPAVVETPYGDLIAVRHMLFMSLSYDHRIVDGMLGGSFLKRVADNLEQFDVNRAW